MSHDQTHLRDLTKSRLIAQGAVVATGIALAFVLTVLWMRSTKRIELCVIEQIDGYLILSGVRDWRGNLKLAEGHGHDHARLARLAHILGCPNASQFDALQADPERPTPPAASCACSCAATIPPPNQE